jgi:hypothetical protein
MTNDATAYLLAAAALAVVTWTYSNSASSELQTKLNACQIEYRGFKEGAVYGK